MTVRQHPPLQIPEGASRQIEIMYEIYTLPGLLPEANASAVIDILSPDDESLKTDTNLSLELVVKWHEVSRNNSY